MILAIYPFISLALFLLSSAQLLSFVVYRCRQRGFTRLQKWLQVSTILCLLLHIIAECLALRSAYSTGHLRRESIVPSRPYIRLAYLNHSLLKVISTLCLNIVLWTAGDVDLSTDSSARPMQAAVCVYASLRCMLALFFNLRISSAALGFETIVMEVFLASEAIILCVLYALVSARVCALKSRNGGLLLPERCLAGSVLGQLVFYSRTLSASFFLESVFRMGAVIVATSPRSPVLSMATDLCNVLKVLYQLLVLEGIGGLIFLDFQKRDGMAQRLVNGVAAMRRNGLRFFRFRPCDKDAVAEDCGI